MSDTAADQLDMSHSAEADRLEQEAAGIAARAAAARAAAAAAAAERARADREAQYRRDRLARFDRTALYAQEREARQAFLEALRADPLMKAFVDWQAARLWTDRAQHRANTDAALVAPRRPSPASATPLPPPRASPTSSPVRSRGSSPTR